jgi:uncharacterized membrane protein YfcA
MTGVELGAYLATGVLSGLLAGLLGVGGGVVVVPSLILVFTGLGFAPDWVAHLAVGTSLAAILGTGGASVMAHHRRGAVRWDLVRRLAPGIVIGAWVGSAVAGLLPHEWLQRIFAVFLLYVGTRMLFARARSEAGELPGALGMGLAGGGIGALSALVGIGGGTMTVPFLERSGLGMRQAVATSSACGLPIAAAGAIGFLVVGWGRDGLPSGSTGFIYWPAVAVILLASIPTAPLGARLAHTLPIAMLKRIFGVLLLVMGVKLLVG